VSVPLDEVPLLAMMFTAWVAVEVVWFSNVALEPDVKVGAAVKLTPFGRCREVIGATALCVGNNGGSHRKAGDARRRR
jgi:hypothetical protein